MLEDILEKKENEKTDVDYKETNGNVIETQSQVASNLNPPNSSCPLIPGTSPSERKRRKLPEIPPNKKPLGKLCPWPKPTSLAEELLESGGWRTEKNITGNTPDVGSCLIHQLSKNLYLEIDTSSTQLKPCLRYSSKDLSLHEDDSSPDDFHVTGRLSVDIDSGNSTSHTPDGIKSMSPVINGSLSRSSSSTLSSTLSASNLQLQDATHRALHKFIPRHCDELEIEIGDPIYVQKEAEDFWFEGTNLRSGLNGIFPSAYVTDVDYADFDSEDKVKRERYLLDFLGSIEVTSHKGNAVLCQAVRKVLKARSSDLGVHGPHPSILEISDQGLRMTDRNRPLPNHVPTHDYFFNLKNVTFCGYYPRDHRYFGFVTKHPLIHKFACHVFMGEESTREVAETVGRAFQRFYHKFIEMAYPTEDIYLE